MAVATGSFDVSAQPCEPTEAEGGDAVTRMVLDKIYHGDLVGTGRGQMLAHRSAIDGSAGYVALELVEATLANQTGSFVLQHFGIMNRDEPSLRVTVVPDSATGDLVGLAGELDIIIADDGGHHYQLTYELSD